MKQTYLIKDCIQERTQKKQYEQHKQKLTTILSSFPKCQQLSQRSKSKYKISSISQNYEKKLNDQNLIHKIMTSTTTVQNYNSNIQKRPNKMNIVLQLQSINEENRNLANRIFSLPSVIKAEQQLQDYQNHISDLKIMKKFHKPKPLTQQDPISIQLNNILDNRLQNSKYFNLNFLKQIGKQKKFIFLLVSKIKLNNKISQDSNFVIRAFYDNKLLCSSNPEIENIFYNTLIGFSIGIDQFSIKYELFRQKQNEEFQLGHFIFTEASSPCQTIQLKSNIEIRINENIESNLKKDIQNESVVIGQIHYKIVQLCWVQQHTIQEPQNQAYQIEVQTASPSKSYRKSVAEIESI